MSRNSTRSKHLSSDTSIWSSFGPVKLASKTVTVCQANDGIVEGKEGMDSSKLIHFWKILYRR